MTYFPHVNRFFRLDGEVFSGGTPEKTHLFILLSVIPRILLIVNSLHKFANMAPRKTGQVPPQLSILRRPLTVDFTVIAILSVYNKQGLLDLAKGLIKHDIRLLASGGTAKRKSFP